MKEKVVVRISDMKIAQGRKELITFALGSCVGISFYDPVRKMGALLHVLLPERVDERDSNLMKYADSGVHETVRQLRMQGFARNITVVKIAGGATMFQGTGQGALSKIGDRNVESVRRALTREGLHITASDTGGTVARTMSLDLESGTVTIREATGQIRYL
ncbi:MAG: chemotaxis protein CheD [Eubacteriales bacterium]|jgi:chemotaxis protein CheD